MRRKRPRAKTFWPPTQAVARVTRKHSLFVAGKGKCYRAKPPRSPAQAVANVVRKHPLFKADKCLAIATSMMLTGHLVQSTQGSYASALRDYLKFTSLRGLRAFPADGLVLAAWMFRMSSYVKPSSMNVYLAAVRHHQELEGIAWSLERNHYIGCAKRWLKRCFPSPVKAAKFPITLAVLKRILPLLPGWPNLDAMSHEDRLFACASILAVMAFLRGGEFMSSPGSVRPILRLRNVAMESVKGSLSTILNIPQPKARFWLTDVRVPCFHTENMGPFSPVALWSALTRGSPAIERCHQGTMAKDNLPAFHFRDGTPLSKIWMLNRTRALCKTAGVSITTVDGTVLSMRAASYRAGGVRSAVDAGLSESMVMSLGHWKSNAWRFYLLHTAMDVQGASRSMWGAPHREESATMRMGFETGTKSATDRDLQAITKAGFLPPENLYDVSQVARLNARIRLHLPALV